jgi:inosine-uridine nucleoside N-ribohydrolase
VAIAAMLHPELVTTERRHCDVELSGELTRGMTVVDLRRDSPQRPNMDVAMSINAEAAVDCILRGLKQA